jgi:SAM-dependent methyltransferase
MRQQSAVWVHDSETERARTTDLMRLTPKGFASVLDAGARDGYYSKILTQRFRSVTAVDLTFPAPTDGVRWVQGDLTELPFPDEHFDVVFCTEVLEHIPALEKACSEIVRVVKHAVVIGVPFRQDIRIGRTTCEQCGKISPPWGHVNSFDLEDLKSLFRPMELEDHSLVSMSRERTSALAVWLMDVAGNPWGVYAPFGSCGHCGAQLAPPTRRSLGQRVCGAAGFWLNRIHSHLATPHADWIHVVFRKNVK